MLLGRRPLNLNQAFLALAFKSSLAAKKRAKNFVFVLVFVFENFVFVLVFVFVKTLGGLCKMEIDFGFGITPWY